MNRDPNILICYVSNREVIMVNISINNFLLASNYLTTFNILKKVLGQKYSIKDLGKVQTIIRWQIIQNLTICILKIDQAAFI